MGSTFPSKLADGTGLNALYRLSRDLPGCLIGEIGQCAVTQPGRVALAAERLLDDGPRQQVADEIRFDGVSAVRDGLQRRLEGVSGRLQIIGTQDRPIGPERYNLSHAPRLEAPM